MKVNINFRLRETYGRKGWTAKETAKRAGIDYHRFKAVETGRLKKWRPEEKRILSKILRVSQKTLFGS